MIDNQTFFIELSKLVLPTVKDNKQRVWYNIPAAFDIEVSSFYQDNIIDTNNKRAIMYIWMFGIAVGEKELVTYGRTWDEFFIFIKMLSKMLNTSNNLRLIVYVHNLPYEFQFIRKRFEWDKTFLLEERKPVYARTNGIEFRCSLKLSGGKSLENVGKDLVSHKVEKKVGDLDYSKIRTALTPISPVELGYCENDIRVLLAYIAEKIDQDGNISNIPLTNTGYVRRYCRKICYTRWKQYRRIMDELTLSPNEFKMLRQGFMGGHTHANANYVDKVLHNVASYDFTSSYPAVMVLEKFPMSRAHTEVGMLSDERLNQLLSTKCCLFDLVITELEPKVNNEHPISKSKCWLLSPDAVIDNGRVVMASNLGITCTEQDLKTYLSFYRWESWKIVNFVYYDKQYLPHKFVESILELYKRKTTLKGVEGEEVNYMIYKNMANASFGMSVTSPVRDEITYNGENYFKNKADLESSIDKYNKDKKRFLFYPWGVWITAYARRNLFTGIEEVGDDFIYSDTDSIKLLNPDKHENYFNQYNDKIRAKIALAAGFHRISESEFSPLNRYGKPKTIGLWDFEGVYDTFKTLGAKRYMYMVKNRNKSGQGIIKDGNEYVLTVAGVNKKRTMNYLIENDNPFDYFNETIVIPKEHSGRLTLTYIDNETDGDVVDYLGTPYHYHELSCVHMENSKYQFKRSDAFINYLKGIHELE